MQGLTINRKGSLRSLYANVDTILDQTGIPKGEVPTDLKRDTILNSLHDMLKPDNFFSVCWVRKASKLTNVVVSAERKAMYDLMHCVHWSDMEEEYRKKLIACLLDDFRSILNNESGVIEISD